MIERTRVSARRRMFALGTLAVVIALGLSYVGKVLYGLAGRTTGDYYTKLGDLTLQLAVVVIVGALVKSFIDWGANERRRQLKALETSLECMRRVRAVSVTVENARDLLNAHKSPKTWSEQSRRLMEVLPEVGEISADLETTHGLFTGKEVISEGLAEIVGYLQVGRQEYVKSHDHVQSDHKNGKTLDPTMQTHDMRWVVDLMNAGPIYQEKYVAGLTRAKATMRSEIYGG